MQSERDFWWIVASFAYHLVDWTLKILGFLTVMLGAYWAFITFGGLGLAVVIVLVAAWRLTNDIARIDEGQHQSKPGPYDFHEHK